MPRNLAESAGDQWWAGAETQFFTEVDPDMAAYKVLLKVTSPNTASAQNANATAHQYYQNDQGSISPALPYPFVPKLKDTDISDAIAALNRMGFVPVPEPVPFNPATPNAILGEVLEQYYDNSIVPTPPGTVVHLRYFWE